MKTKEGRGTRGVRASTVEVSIVLPCLNEAETLAACIHKARRALGLHGLKGEIVVADNGSSDGSVEVAEHLADRVIAVAEKGYGNALSAGIAAAKGRFVLMADSDDSYDLESVPAFVEKLRAGYDLVIGNRFQGGIRPGAMPWLHRWFGNPALTGVGRLFFGAPIGDFHCGIRAFRREAYERLDLRTAGMEFASEMVIKAALEGLRIAELPTVLSPDGRSRRPHLRTWRDGWRHLRFMLLFSPRWLFLIPGIATFLTGSLVSVWLISAPRRLGPLGLDIHTLLVAGVLCLIGYQLVVFAVFTKFFAIREGLHPARPGLVRLWRYVNLEVGLLAGALMLLAGAALLAAAILSWSAAGFGALDPRDTMRVVIPAVVLLALGTQTVFASFFLSILGMPASRTAASSRAV